MTGPEHYREAERLLAMAGEPDGFDRYPSSFRAAAAVHAQLAQVAAMALGATVSRTGDEAEMWARAWRDVLGADPVP